MIDPPASSRDSHPEVFNKKAVLKKYTKLVTYQSFLRIANP